MLLRNHQEILNYIKQIKSELINEYYDINYDNKKVELSIRQKLGDTFFK